VPIMHEFVASYSSVGWVAALATAGLALAGKYQEELVFKSPKFTSVSSVTIMCHLIFCRKLDFCSCHIVRAPIRARH